MNQIITVVTLRGSTGATSNFRNQEVCSIGMSYKSFPSSFSRWHLNLWASFYLNSTIFLFRELQLKRLQAFIWEAKIGGTQISQIAVN